MNGSAGKTLLSVFKDSVHCRFHSGKYAKSVLMTDTASNDEVLDLVDAYLGHGILGEKYRNDLIHMALASVFSVDIVASWNFKHIVRYEKIVKFNAVNLELGYKQLAIHSPREVSSYGKD